MDREILMQKYAQLKFCPVCGKELERNPLSGDFACFVHGDFVGRKIGEELVVTFRFTNFF